MNRHFRILASLPLLAAAACGSVPTRTFEFDVIGVDDQPRPCLIVINGEWTAAIEKNQVVNVAGDDSLQITIPFPSNEVEVTAAPMRAGATKPPMSRKEAVESSDCQDEVRKLQLTDPRRVLFILPKRRVGS